MQAVPGQLFMYVYICIYKQFLKQLLLLKLTFNSLLFFSDTDQDESPILSEDNQFSSVAEDKSPSILDSDKTFTSVNEDKQPSIVTDQFSSASENKTFSSVNPATI